MDVKYAGFQRYLPFAKVDDEQRMVWGYASTPALDLDDEVVKLGAIKDALPDYMEWGNIREMHQPSAVGVAAETRVDEKGLWLGAHVSDDQAWKKCKPTVLADGTILPPVYKGFSIGGQVTRKVGKSIESLKLIEISLVDRPANPECRIEVVKGAQVVSSGEARLVRAAELPMGDLTVEEVPDIGLFSRALRKMGLRLGIVKGYGGSDVVSGHDLTHPSGTAVGEHTHTHTEHGMLPSVADDMPKDPANPGEGALHDAFRSHLLPLDKDAGEEAKKPYGDVHYADPGYQSDGKHRYPVDSEQHVRAAWSYIHQGNNRTPYTAEQLSHIESAIVSAWHSIIGGEGPPSAAKALGISEDVAKALWNIGPLADAAQSLAITANSLSWEFSDEGGDTPDSEMADEARALAARTARLIAQIAEHEAGEIESTSTTKGAATMPNTEELAKRVSRAAQEHLDRAQHHITKAAACQKEAMSCCKSLAAMHKEAAMKAAAGDMAKDAGAGFDHNAAADHVVKMHGALTQMMDHHEMASHHIGKAAGNVDTGEATQWTGERVGTAPVSNSGVQVPADGPMPGKAAGTYTQSEVDLMVKNAALEAELGALRKSPAGVRRGINFNPATELAATVGTDKQSVLLRGVNVDPSDADSVSKGTARMIGNMLSNPGMFGKNPSTDPTFNGAAG